ncbi:MAG: LAGLIDADG family homing endonuclease [Candidatus Paceibacterota bacterium]
MAKHWTKEEEVKYHSELSYLYTKKNKSLREVSEILNLKESTVFRRMKRLKIKTTPYLKKNYLKKRNNIKIPNKYSEDLAEFFGIMLGDGHISHFQIVVSLGNKEEKYAKHVSLLIKKIFKTDAKISLRKTGYRDVYLGSVDLTSWLFKKGLVSNKVKSQVNVPSWIFNKDEFIRAFLRGFFDTDGSVYKLKYGIQISFCNRSLPILKSLQIMLKRLRYNPSSISGYNLYLTRRKDVKRFFEEIKPSNNKHIDRHLIIENNLRRSDSGYSRRL